MLPLSVALPLTLRLPWISTSPGLTVTTVFPAITVVTLPFTLVTSTLELPELIVLPDMFKLVSPLPSPTNTPGLATTKLPVT